VITDGGSGIAAALSECWSETAVERCLVHIQREARTYRSKTAVVPGWVRANQSWWYTHDGLREAYRLLERLGQAGTLFTCLKGEYAGLDIASTTNRIEGGTNAQPRLLLGAHRGMSQEHQKRAIE
jgi:hypothetical protein